MSKENKLKSVEPNIADLANGWLKSQHIAVLNEYLSASGLRQYE